MKTREFSAFDTAADADLLAGSELEFAPSDGIYVCRFASTVNTATIACSTNGQAGLINPARAITLRANAEIQTIDPTWHIPVMKGEKVILALAGTTGTVQTHVDFVGK